MAAQALQVDFLLSGAHDPSTAKPLEFGTAGFFEIDGITPKTIWEDGNKDVEGQNPVILSADGTAVVFADGEYSYVLRDSSGAIVKTVESVTYIVSSLSTLIGIDASLFGSGDDSNAIKQAIDSAGGENATVFLKAQQWDIDTSIVVPININLLFAFGAQFVFQTGVVLDVVGTIDPGSPLFNIFTGPGTVLLSNFNNDIPTIWLPGGSTTDRILTGQTFIEQAKVTGEFLSDVDLEFSTGPIRTIGFQDGLEKLEFDQTANEISATVNGVKTVTFAETGIFFPAGIVKFVGYDGSLQGITFDDTVAAEAISLTVNNRVISDFGETYQMIFGVDNNAAHIVLNTALTEISDLRPDAAGHASFELRDNAGVATIAFRAGTGFVGIGTDAPQTRLNVRSLADGADVFRITDSVNSQRVNSYVSAGNEGKLDLYDSVAALGLSLSGGSELSFINPFLGLNAADPFYQLDSNGDIRIRGANYLRFGGTGAGDADTLLQRSGVETLEVTNNLNVIGTLTAGELILGTTIFTITNTVNAGSQINAALVSIGANGGVICLGVGTFLLDVPVIITNPGITICGQSRYLTTLQVASPSPPISNMFNIQADNCTVQDIHFQGFAGGSQFANDIILATGGRDDILINRCSFDGAAVSSVSSEGGNFVMRDCEVDVSLNSKGVSIQSQGFLERVRFSATGNPVGTSGVTYSSSNGLTMRDCIFFQIRKSVDIPSASEDIYLENNNFTQCENAIHALGFVRNLWVSNHNDFLNGTSDIITLLTGSENVEITNNLILGHSGGRILFAESFRGGKFDDNIIQNSSFSNAVEIPGNTTSIESPVSVSGNLFSDISATRAIWIRFELTTDLDESGVSVLGNKVVTGTGMDTVIDVRTQHALINDNQISNIVGVGGPFGFVGIHFLGGAEGRSVVAHNIIRDITAGPTEEVTGIYINSDDVNVSTNIVDFDANTSGLTTGIRENSANLLNIQGNRVRVTNAGAGIGNAFDINVVDGIAIGNMYTGSDALGVLTLPVVSNNHP
jgi:hypothetical protein